VANKDERAYRDVLFLPKQKDKQFSTFFHLNQAVSNRRPGLRLRNTAGTRAVLPDRPILPRL
jgi:hypothetical protein